MRISFSLPSQRRLHVSLAQQRQNGKSGAPVCGSDAVWNPGAEKSRYQLEFGVVGPAGPARGDQFAGQFPTRRRPPRRLCRRPSSRAAGPHRCDVVPPWRLRPARRSLPCGRPGGPGPGGPGPWREGWTGPAPLRRARSRGTPRWPGCGRGRRSVRSPGPGRPRPALARLRGVGQPVSSLGARLYGLARVDVSGDVDDDVGGSESSDAVGSDHRGSMLSCFYYPITTVVFYQSCTIVTEWTSPCPYRVSSRHLTGRFWPRWPRRPHR